MQFMGQHEQGYIWKMYVPAYGECYAALCVGCQPPYGSQALQDQKHGGCVCVCVCVFVCMWASHSTSLSLSSLFSLSLSLSLSRTSLSNLFSRTARCALLLTMVIASSGVFIIENPGSSLIFHHDRLQWLLQQLEQVDLGVPLLR